jgi:hypothetical protein
MDLRCFRCCVLTLLAIVPSYAGPICSAVADDELGADQQDQSSPQEKIYEVSQSKDLLAQQDASEPQPVYRSTAASSLAYSARLQPQSRTPNARIAPRPGGPFLPGQNYGRGVQGPDPYNRLLRQDGPIRVRGWLDAGILGNTASPASHFNGPYNSQEVDNGQFNQFYLIMDRALRDDGFSVGGRFDMLYGSDYVVAQSTGLEVTRTGSPRWNSSQYYGLALPQAYLEVGRTDASIKVGHFYSIVGYEGVQAANNFFYSHAYSYQFAGPFTHWGGLGTWKPTNNWQIQAGLVNGWNNLDEVANHASFLGGAKYTSDAGDWWTSFAIITGDEFTNPAGLTTVPNTFANRTRYSFIVAKQLNRRLEYVFHQWLGSQASGEPGGGTAFWYGIDQYLYYRMNDRWRLGTRVEWFRDEDGTRVGLTERSNPNKAPLPGSYGSWTVGANWNPRQNVVIRPELRWDTYQGPAKPFDDGNKTYQLLLGADAIVQF